MTREEAWNRIDAIIAKHEIDDEYAHLYNDLWAEADGYAVDNLKGAELTYFYDITD